MRTITISGPGKNAMGVELMGSVLAQVREAAVSGEPLMLTGDGDAFSAGLNLKEVHALDIDGMRGFHRVLEDLTEAIWLYPGPTAAAVNGHAIAGGMILALMCDFRVVANNDRARLGLNEVALGLRFPPRLLAMVRDRLDARHEYEVLLGAQLHSPSDALRLGMVDLVADDPAAIAAMWLDKAGAHPAGAYAGAKAMMRSAIGLTDEQRRHFDEEVLPIWVSAEVKGRIAGFLKR